MIRLASPGMDSRRWSGTPSRNATAASSTRVNPEVAVAAEGSAAREHDRLFDLSIRNRPVAAEQRHFLFRRDELEAMPLVEADCPCRRRPGANQDRAIGERAQVRKERGAEPAALRIRPGVGMTDQGHVLHRLDAHDRVDPIAFDGGPEADARVDLRLQFLARHVRVVPAVDGYHAAIRLGGVVDYREELIDVSQRAPADHGLGRGAIRSRAALAAPPRPGSPA